jgi:hypothetical protein
MGLTRITRRYLADDSGLRDLGLDDAAGSIALAAAELMAAAAIQSGKGDYVAAPTIVTAGWANERRSGAVVRESRHDFRDSRDAILLTVLDNMAMRGSGIGSVDPGKRLVKYTRKDGTTRMATAAQAAHWGRGRSG